MSVSEAASSAETISASASGSTGSNSNSNSNTAVAATATVVVAASPPPTKKKSGMDSVAAKRLFQFCAPEWPRIGLGLTALVVNAVTNLSFPMIMGKVVDGIGGKGGGYENPLFRLGTASVFVVGGLASWVRIYCLGTAEANIKSRLYKALFSSCIDRDLETYDKTTTGELVTIFKEDTNEASLAFTEKLSSAIRSLNSAVNGSIILFMTSPLLCGVSLSVVPVVGIGAMMMSKFAKKFDGALRSLESKMISFVIERIQGISTVKINQQEQNERNTFNAMSDDSLDLTSKVSFNQGAFTGFIGFTTNVSLGAVLAVGGRLLAQGKLTTGTLTQFVMQSVFVGLGFAGLSTIYSDFVKCFDAARRIFDAIDISTSKRSNVSSIADCDSSSGIQSAAAAATVTVTSSSVDKVACDSLSLHNLSFFYANRPDNVVLSNVSMEISPRRMTAIVGPSGAGKSTLLSLLCGLYRSYEGKIVLNGVSLAEASTSFIRNHMGVVEQRPLLLSGSIAANISYGKNDATHDEIVTASKMASADSFIDLFPEKYNTEVGERGSQLSGGQQARIALARALLRDPSILILDEVTAALDKESEIAIGNTLKSLCAEHNKTIILFTHSQGLIELADKVFTLSNGQVIG